MLCNEEFDRGQKGSGPGGPLIVAQTWSVQIKLGSQNWSGLTKTEWSGLEN